MKKLIIAVDVDGVLRDLVKKCVEVYNANYGETYGYKKVEDIKTYYMNEALTEVKNIVDINKFLFIDHNKELFLDSEVINNAKLSMDKLQEMGEVIIVTYQPNFNDKIYTLEWLKKNNINYNGICFLGNKSYVQADYLIDDNQEFIADFLENNPNKRAILIDTPYNRMISRRLSKFLGTNMVICDDLNEALKFIENYD